MLSRAEGPKSDLAFRVEVPERPERPEFGGDACDTGPVVRMRT
ncbi:hypothetical protein [Streptosporangium vulgare]|uniref:Uncharacterized protein n=1 Tax=Streptosporangium vulgare TaxID=46190 RepID=A0ABV5TS03_9ACTN